MRSLRAEAWASLLPMPVLVTTGLPLGEPGSALYLR